MTDQSALFAHGEVFGHLTVLRRSKSKRKQGPRYQCGCSCGRMVFVKGSKLRKGAVKDCGAAERHLCKDDS